MDIRLIALDLDRTTLNAKGQLSQANEDAIRAAIANGVHVCIASGRAFDTLPKDVVKIPGIEYAITGNGAAIYDVVQKKCIHSYPISAQAVQTVLKISQNYPVTYEAFIDGVAYAGEEYIANPVKFGATEQAVAYVQSTRHLQKDIVAFIHQHIDELDSMDVIVKTEEMKQELMRKTAAATDEVYLTSSVTQLLEIAHKDAGEQSGVKYIAQKLGIEREQIAAFGDALNDLDMITYAGVGIAMENASDEVKQEADYVTLHHDEDGIAYAFHHILGVC